MVVCWPVSFDVRVLVAIHKQPLDLTEIKSEGYQMVLLQFNHDPYCIHNVSHIAHHTDLAKVLLFCSSDAMERTW
jgi:hypothetical protein